MYHGYRFVVADESWEFVQGASSCIFLTPQCRRYFAVALIVSLPQKVVNPTSHAILGKAVFSVDIVNHLPYMAVVQHFLSEGIQPFAAR